MSHKQCNRLKPAESYTHTHTHTHTHTCSLLLSLLSIFAFVSPSFSSGISSNANSASCDNSTLEKYTGTSNLTANWTGNHIDLYWYADSEATTPMTVASESQDCTYGGSLTPPAASSMVNLKPGYTFKGWRVKSCFASQVCGLNGSAVNGLTYDDSDSTAYGYYSHNGQWKENESTYGLTAGEWAVKYTSGGIIKGIASCNSTKPTIMETIMTALDNGTMTEEQVPAAEYGSCASDAIKPGNTFSSSSGGQYCWCKMTSYTPSGGSACNVASPSWVFGYSYGSASNCANSCADECSYRITDNADFRRAVFGVAQ